LAVQLALKRFPRDTMLEELRNVLRVSAELGKGVYGVVYEATIISPLPPALSITQSIAIKSISTLDQPTSRENVLTKMMREEMAYAYLNALVFLRICPNFALVHKSFLSRHRQQHKMYCYLLTMEKADGNLREWISLKKPDSNTKWVSSPSVFMFAVFQLFVAITAYGTHLNMVHNDLYLKNILYNSIPKTTMIYHFRNRTYTLPNCEFLFKVSDFGICSSPTYLQNEHRDMVLMTKERRHAPSLVEFDFSNHVLEYGNILPFARDSAILLRSLLYAADVHSSCRAWLTNSLKLLDDNMPHTASELGNFVNEIFSKRFLQRAGISPQLFDTRIGNGLETIDASTESFRVEGNADTNRSMMFLACDYIAAGSSPSNGPTTPPSTLSTPATFF
jgi:serine/threonine protein kinase